MHASTCALMIVERRRGEPAPAYGTRRRLHPRRFPFALFRRLPPDRFPRPRDGRRRRRRPPPPPPRPPRAARRASRDRRPSSTPSAPSPPRFPKNVRSVALARASPSPRTSRPRASARPRARAWSRFPPLPRFPPSPPPLIPPPPSFALSLASASFSWSSRITHSFATRSPTSGRRSSGYLTPTTFVPSSAVTFTARMPRSLLLKRCSFRSKTRSSTPHAGTTAPETMQHRVARDPLAHRGPRSHCAPCTHERSVIAYVRSQCGLSSSSRCSFGTRRYLRSNSSASISKNSPPCSAA